MLLFFLIINMFGLTSLDWVFLSPFILIFCGLLYLFIFLFSIVGINFKLGDIRKILKEKKQ